MNGSAVAILSSVIGVIGTAGFSFIGWLLRQPLNAIRHEMRAVTEDVAEVRDIQKDDRNANNHRLTDLEHWSRRHVEGMHRA